MNSKFSFAGFTDWIKENATMALCPLLLVCVVDNAEPLTLFGLIAAIYIVSFMVITVSRFVMILLDL